MTGGADDRVPRCPKENRPLHPLGDGTSRLHCLRCGARYSPDDTRIVWGPSTPARRRDAIGGPAIGGLMLGAERAARLRAAAVRDGLPRNELIRRAIDFYPPTRPPAGQK